MNTSRLLRRGITALVLAAAVVVLLIKIPGPWNVTTGPGTAQTIEKSNQGPDLQGASSQPPVLEQDQQEAASAPDEIAASGRQNTQNEGSPAPMIQPARETPDPTENGPLSISGMVVDEAGRPVYGIEVRVTAKRVFAVKDDGGALPGDGRKALTDDGGFYEVRGIADGLYRVHTLADDFYEATQAMVRAGAETADLVLRERQPDVGVSGIVTGAGEPLDNVQVVAVGQSGNAAYTDTKGFYELDLKIVPGKTGYSLQFTRDGYREKRLGLQTGEAASAGWNQVNAEMEPSKEFTEVTGTVRNAKGEPVAGETVQLYSESARQRYSIKSDDNGDFRIEEVETSPDYMLAVNPKKSYRDYFMRDVNVSVAGADLEVVLEPLAVGSIIGQMVDPNGVPVPEFSLWLRNRSAVNQPSRLVTGDQQGVFEVDQVEAGELIFETRGSPLYQISGIHLSEQEEKSVMLVLDRGNYQVTGLVVDDMGRAVTASELFATSVRRDGGLLAQATRRAITDASGYFLFTWVGPGYHTIRVDIPGFRTAILDHDVGRENTEVIIRLQRANSNDM